MGTVKYTACADWASYLINGDASGFDDDDADQAQADAFIEWVGLGGPVDVAECGFMHRCDFPPTDERGRQLACDAAEYTFIDPDADDDDDDADDDDDDDAEPSDCEGCGSEA